MSDTRDRILGTLYGQAIGDALGLPAEFKSPNAIRELQKNWGNWPNAYAATGRSQYGWKAGEWSDDTEQAICLLDAYLNGVKDGEAPDAPVSLFRVSDLFVKWAQENGKGMGNHTWNVLQDGLFLLDPHAVSADVWERSGRQSAPNGAVMRTAYMGIMRPHDLAWTAQEAASTAKTTHYDPRCVASAVAVSVTIAALVTGSTVPEAIQTGVRYGGKHHGDVAKYATMSLDELDLAEGLEPKQRRVPIGFTYKCMGAGFWALREFQRRDDEMHDDLWGDRFLNVLQKVILAGGDADTNGAVAGAMLGAVAGMQQMELSHPWMIQGLVDKQQLDSRAVALFGIQG